MGRPSRRRAQQQRQQAAHKAQSEGMMRRFTRPGLFSRRTQTDRPTPLRRIRHGSAALPTRAERQRAAHDGDVVLKFGSGARGLAGHPLESQARDDKILEAWRSHGRAPGRPRGGQRALRPAGCRMFRLGPSQRQRLISAGRRTQRAVQPCDWCSGAAKPTVWTAKSPRPQPQAHQSSCSPRPRSPPEGDLPFLLYVMAPRYTPSQTSTPRAPYK